MKENNHLRKKNFGLSEEEFQSLIEQLCKGNERLIDLIYVKHVKNCIIHLMQRRGSPYEEAYDCAIDAIIELQEDLVNNKLVYGNLESYFTNRASRIYYKRTQIVRTQAFVDMQGIDMDEADKVDTQLIESELNELVAKAIKKLCPECESILKWHYFEEVPFTKIASSMGIKYNTAVQKATRCRNKLRALIGEDFYQQFKPYFRV